MVYIYEYNLSLFSDIQNSLYKTLEYVFNNIQEEVLLKEIKKAIFCCSETMLLDEAYIRCVASHKLPHCEGNIDVIGTKAPVYDYWLKEAGEEIGRNNIYMMIRIEKDKGDPEYRAALFAVKDETIRKSRRQRIIYFDMISNSKISQFLEIFQKKKQKYKEFNFIVLCKTDDQVSEKDLTELKDKINDVREINSTKYDRVRGALLRLIRKNGIFAEEYADLNYIPSCKFTIIEIS